MKTDYKWHNVLASTLATMLSLLLMSLAGLSGFLHNPYQIAIWLFVFLGTWRCLTWLLDLFFPRTTPQLDAKAQENKAIVAQFFK